VRRLGRGDTLALPGKLKGFVQVNGILGRKRNSYDYAALS